MGMTKTKMCEYKKALDLFEDALLVLKSSLGKRHSSVATTLSQIGAVHFEMGDFTKAMNTLTEAEHNQISSIGENSRDTLETQAMIGRVLCRQGEYDTALKKLRAVAKKQMTLFGASHPSIADTKQYIGEVFLEQGKASEARAMYIDSYNMRKLFFGMDQIHIAESMVDIIRAREGKPEQALAVYKNAMDVYKEYLSDDHIQIGRLLMFEGDAYAELLDFSTAIERYEKAKRIFLDVLDEGHVIEADVAGACILFLLYSQNVMATFNIDCFRLFYRISQSIWEKFCFENAITTVQKITFIGPWRYIKQNYRNRIQRYPKHYFIWIEWNKKKHYVFKCNELWLNLLLRDHLHVKSIIVIIQYSAPELPISN